jgi:hypothetical protein
MKTFLYTSRDFYDNISAEIITETVLSEREKESRRNISNGIVLLISCKNVVRKNRNYTENFNSGKQLARIYKEYKPAGCTSNNCFKKENIK